MKNLFALMVIALAFVGGALAQQSDCVNGEPFCLGCDVIGDSKTGYCIQCHGLTSEGEFYMTQINDKWYCFCSCFHGMDAQMKVSALQHSMPIPASKTVLVAGKTVNMNDPRIAAHVRFWQPTADQKNACRVNTINKVLSSGFLMQSVAK